MYETKLKYFEFVLNFKPLFFKSNYSHYKKYKFIENRNPTNYNFFLDLTYKIEINVRMI